MFFVKRKQYPTSLLQTAIKVDEKDLPLVSPPCILGTLPYFLKSFFSVILVLNLCPQFRPHNCWSLSFLFYSGTEITISVQTPMRSVRIQPFSAHAFLPACTGSRCSREAVGIQMGINTGARWQFCCSVPRQLHHHSGSNAASEEEV